MPHAWLRERRSAVAPFDAPHHVAARGREDFGELVSQPGVVDHDQHPGPSRPKHPRPGRSAEAPASVAGHLGKPQPCQPVRRRGGEHSGER